MLFGLQANVVVTSELVEPLIFLRKPPQWSEGGGGCQVRGVINVDVRKPVKASAVRLMLIGKATGVEFKHGTPVERHTEVHSQSNDMPLLLDDDVLAVGVHPLPFSLSVPSTLPPTVDVEFGKTLYHLHAELMFGGKSIAQAEPVSIRVICDAAWSESQTDADPEDREADPPVRTQTARGDWRDAMHFEWKTLCNWANIGAYVPFTLNLVPLSDDVRVHGIRVRLDEVTQVRSNPQHQVRRSWRLLEVSREKHNTIPILPCEQKDEMQETILAAAKRAKTMQTGGEAAVGTEAKMAQMYVSSGEGKDDDNDEVQTEKARTMITSSSGPWSLAWEAQMPVCALTRCMSTIQHAQSPVTVGHTIHVELTLASKDQQSIVDLSLPMIVRSLYLMPQYASLPCYWCSCFLPHPYEARETRTEGGLLEYYDGHAPQSSTTSSASSSEASSLSTTAATTNGSSLLPALVNAFFTKSPPSQKQNGKHADVDALPPPYSDSSGVDVTRSSDAFIAQRDHIASQWLLLTSNHSGGTTFST